MFNIHTERVLKKALEDFDEEKLICRRPSGIRRESERLIDTNDTHNLNQPILRARSEHDENNINIQSFIHN